jgi:glycosyltransferase involved in cell wall biosynthesis
VLRNIVVDLTPVLPGGENGGAKVFVVELLRLLAELTPQTNFILLTQASAHEELAVLDRNNMRRLMVLDSGPAHAPPSFAKRVIARVMVNLPARARSLVGRMFHTLRGSMKRSGSKSLLRNLKADLLFCPFTAPTYYDAGVKTVSIIYDLQHKTYPQFFAPEYVAQRDRTFIDAARRATILVAISDYSRDTAIAAGGLDPNQIKTIHLHISQHSLSTASRDDAVLLRLSLVPKHYVVYPANFWKHKNHEMLLTAFGIAMQNGLANEVRLVCTGAPSERQRWLKHAADEMGLGDQIVFAGYLTTAELLSLVTNSSGVVFPSLYEGFGLPVIEAMASGVPVACSNSTSLPEVAGGAAILFDPRNPESLAKAIISLVSDKDLTASLVEAGTARAAMFSNSKLMAEQFWDVFQQATDQHVKYSHHLIGVHADGWMGPSVTLEVAAADGPQTLNVETSLPTGLAYKRVKLRIEEGDQTILETVVESGKLNQITLPIALTGGVFSIDVSPTFVPSTAGGGLDHRELSAQLLKCEIVKPGGEVVVLFPEGRAR